MSHNLLAIEETDQLYLNQYYLAKFAEAKREIGDQDDEKILVMDEEKVAQSYCDRFNLPLLQRDENRPITNEGFSRREVRDDSGILSVTRYPMIRVFYPIRLADRTDEVFNRSALHEKPMHGYFLSPGKDSIVIDTHDQSVRTLSDYDESTIMNATTRGIIGLLEEHLTAKNEEVTRGNEFLKRELTKFVKDLKTALLKDRAKPRDQSSEKRKAEGDDGDWDDHDRGRSPNDDRSDSMNPNNPAYDAAQDNRADQLNPNNPRYQGE